MATIDEMLFSALSDALDAELAAVGAKWRVVRDSLPQPGMLLFQDQAGQRFGPIPDHVDAATIKAIETMIGGSDGAHQRS